jgi:ribosome-associated translation inhibitor RaiA
MKFSVAYHKVDHSDALNEFIEMKSKKLNRFLQAKSPINWVIQKKGKSYSSSARIHHFGKSFHVESNNINAYSSVSKSFDKLVNKIVNEKKKIARSVHNISLPQNEAI